MKKGLLISNLVLLPIIYIGIMHGFLNNISLLEIFSIAAMFLLTSANVAYQIFTKSKTLKFGVFIFLSIILSLISTLFMNTHFVAGMILQVISLIAILTAVILNEKFSLSDLLYMGAIALATIITFIFAPIFGFGKVYVKILILAYMLIVSSLFGKTIADLKKGFSLTRLFVFIASFVLFIFNILLMMRKFSNISFKFDYVLYLILVLASIIFIFTIYTSVKPAAKYSNSRTNHTHIKKHILSSILILLTTFLTFYAFTGSMVWFNVASAVITKNEFLAKVENNLNIPIVEISTENNVLPINKKDYVNCSFSLSNCDNEDYNFSVNMANSFDYDYDNQNSVGIRLRGNSTKKARKRPYRIKFEEKQSLFGLTKNKSWVLLADYYDQSYIRNYAAFTLADSFDNLHFSPTPHHVALIINGEFKGLYLLCEQMDENKGRAQVKEDFDVTTDTNFPFLVEMDLYAYSEGVTGIDNFYVEDVNHVEIKYPEADERDATADQDIVYDYIYEYMNAVFKTIKTNEKIEVSFSNTPVGLEDLVDLDSAVDYYIINEIMLNIDSAAKSIYFHKPKDGKLQFGPIWDFDFSMTTEYVAPFEKSYIEGTESLWLSKNSVVFKDLIKNEIFYNKVSSRFDEKKEAILETCKHLKEYKNTIDSVALLDSQMWHGSTGEFQYDMQYDYVRLFLYDRYEYLTEVFAKSHSEFLTLVENA